ncbi:MAG: LytR/AlgR family response regulator transcription factor [Bacteroidales bacterium]
MTRNTANPVSAVIIDDDKAAIFALQSFLELIPEVSVKGTATSCQKAIKLIREQAPDLVFLDIEMPGKSGFELLKELEKDGSPRNFKVIFHTAYDKYSIAAIREAAFDFILKPPREVEIKEAIHRFLKQEKLPPEAPGKSPGQSMSQMVALPTSIGLQFLPKSDLVYVECLKSSFSLRSTWSVVLNNTQQIKLRPNTNACSIISHLGADQFIALSQSVIVNISYVSMVEYKTLHCYLFPPFDQKPLKISRQYMMLLREKFDVI